VRGDASPKSANTVIVLELLSVHSICWQNSLSQNLGVLMFKDSCNRNTSSGVNRPIPEVNCYDCVDKSLIEVRRDYYDLLVSLPKYMQQIRSFFSTRLTKLQCWEETIPVWITYKRVVYTLARHKCLGYSNYRSKAIPFSRPLSLMSTELTESISSHPASCGASKQSSCSLTW